jgi:hypothetical protein
MKTTELSAAQAGPVQGELRVRVQDALGELVEAAREGLLALSVGVGLGVLAELMEEEVVEVVGVKGKHDPQPGELLWGSIGYWPCGGAGPPPKGRPVIQPLVISPSDSATG